MAINKRILTILVLLVTLLVLEKGNFNFHFHSPVLITYKFQTLTIAVLLDPGIYTASILINTSNAENYEQLLSNLNATSFPLEIDNVTEIQDITVTTVCVSTDAGFQCECEEQFAWPYRTCISYGACDSISGGICTCIKGFPADGSSCQLISELLVQTEYEVDLELNVTDVATVDFLRILLNNGSAFTTNAVVNVTQIAFTTVCSPNGGGYQCRCEDQYRWSCDQCQTYGSCDNITGDTCGCINGIPADGQYCQSLDQYTPPFVYLYFLHVELNSTDVAAVRELRKISYPISINSYIEISDVNISTVCSPIGGGYQCRCEDQYRWSCDQCQTYGSCDNITGDTCGCINGIPADGQYCQSLDQYSEFTKHVTYQYNLFIELKTTDDAAVGKIRNLSFTISINNDLQISDLKISTVCFPNNTTYQCRCEDQYAWPCDMCSTFGECSNIQDNTCRCINALPPNDTYCQPLSGKCTYFITFSLIVFLLPITVVRSEIRSSFLKQNLIPVGSITSHPTTNTTRSTPMKNNTAGLFDSQQPTFTSTSTNSTTPLKATTTEKSTPAPSTSASTTSISASTATTMTSVSTTTTTASPQTTPTTTSAPSTKTTTTTTNAPKPSTSSTKGTTALASTTITSEIPVEDPGFYVLVLGGHCSASFRYLCFSTPKPGSVIADFTVKMSGPVDLTEITEANSRLDKALGPIARVLATPTAEYNSPNQLKSSVKDYIFTGKTITLTCDPSNVNMGKVKTTEWKFNGFEIRSERHKISSSENQSNLVVEKVISGDAGLYECILRGEGFSFIQKRTVKNSEIRQAPNVRISQTRWVKCEENKNEKVTCCVQSPYKVKWYEGSTELSSVPEKDSVVCEDEEYGTGRAGDKASAMCADGLEGKKIAECQENGAWKLIMDSCIVTKINELLIDSADLKEEEIQVFSANLSKAVQKEEEQISQSSATISAIVDILNTIARVSQQVNEDVMQNVLNTVDVIVGDDAKESWDFLNTNQTQNSSSELLSSLETISDKLTGKFALSTQRIQLDRTQFSGSFNEQLTSNVTIELPETGLNNISITTIVFSSLHNVMPARNSSFDFTISNNITNETTPDNAINGAVLLVKVDETIRNVNLSFQKRNPILQLNPQCVFWNFSLFDRLGAWDDQGCKFVSDINDTVTCTCNHLTSFSILMSTDVPESIRKFLKIITYIGVGISMVSLLICLVIEGIVWRALTKNSTAFMRHVAIVNTALSLLIADICFIIGAAIVKNPKENPDEDYTVPLGPCSAATFFMHFFYLAMFFWMFVSSLLLLYRTVMVFSEMSKWTMFAIGLTVGYVCPLIIAVTTVAATAPGEGYIREDLACWLNWTKTKALLAMVIPALIIVVFNILVIILVLYKMVRRRSIGNTSQAGEKNALVVILRCVAILSPLFGLTWSLGIGTMVEPTNAGIHVAFAFFNSLQGFFILVFGTLFDSKVC
uniref:Adhesion G protein-coupled receptor F5-like n=1 Tax=Cyprinodon variegatus TaxID=28743 RepID=A0A3Q2FFE4_CYPVA